MLLCQNCADQPTADFSPKKVSNKMYLVLLCSICSGQFSFIHNQLVMLAVLRFAGYTNVNQPSVCRN